ncbi:MAG: hypothetical protein IKM29_04570 [Clostridia bacterium]|nr:hypothetical protein [Clostridia bacterium]
MTGAICCFLGHREIRETTELKNRLSETVEKLIIHKNVDTFLFGSKSCFNELCRKTVSEIKERYPNIRRIYVRAEFPDISESYEKYLLEMYDDTYYPDNIRGSGKAAYVERNFHMIEQSQFCVFYYNVGYAPVKRKSGTKIALDHAVKRNKEIIIFE